MKIWIWIVIAIIVIGAFFLIFRSGGDSSNVKKTSNSNGDLGNNSNLSATDRAVTGNIVQNNDDVDLGSLF